MAVPNLVNPFQSVSERPGNKAGKLRTWEAMHLGSYAPGKLRTWEVTHLGSTLMKIVCCASGENKVDFVWRHAPSKKEQAVGKHCPREAYPTLRHSLPSMLALFGDMHLPKRNKQ